MEPCKVRPATPADAEAAVSVICSAITMLCAADNHDDPATLDRPRRLRGAHFASHGKAVRKIAPS